MEFATSLLHNFCASNCSSSIWIDFKKRFLNHIKNKDSIQNEIVAPNQDVTSVLLHIAGNSLIDHLQSFKTDSRDRVFSANTLMSFIEDTYFPAFFILLERYKFYTCKQKEGESFLAYFTKLNLLAETCEFLNRDECIRNQMIASVQSEHARRTLEKYRGPLDWMTALQICHEIKACSTGNCACEFDGKMSDSGHEHIATEHYYFHVSEKDMISPTTDRTDNAEMKEKCTTASPTQFEQHVSKHEPSDSEDEFEQHVSKHEPSDSEDEFEQLGFKVEICETDDSDDSGKTNSGSLSYFSAGVPSEDAHQHNLMLHIALENGTDKAFSTYSQTHPATQIYSPLYEIGRDQDDEVIETYDRAVTQFYGRRDIVNLQEDEKKDEEIINLMLSDNDFDEHVY